MDERIHLRIMKEEKARIYKEAKALGIVASALIRNRALGHNPCKNCAYENFPINGICTCKCHEK